MTVFWHEFSYKQVFKAFSLSIRFFIRTRLIEQASKTVRRKKSSESALIRRSPYNKPGRSCNKMSLLLPG